MYLVLLIPGHYSKYSMMCWQMLMPDDVPASPFLSVSPAPGSSPAPSHAPGPHPSIISFPPFGQCNKTYTKRDMSLALEALR